MIDSRSIKVLVVVPTLECGGAERYVSLLCNHLDDPHIQLQLVVINNAQPFYTIRKDIPVINLNTKRVSQSLAPLLKVIKKAQPDIVYSVGNHLNLLLAIFQFRLPRKTVLVCRETSIVSINATNARYPKFYRSLLNIFYKRIPFIICQSYAMQQDLAENFGVIPAHTTVIHNAVSPDLTYQHVPVKEFTFVTVGRLSPEKGIDIILEALAKLKCDFKYRVIGDGPESKRLHSLTQQFGIAEKVTFTGALKDPFQRLHDQQLFLMASQYEGFPNAVIEANAIGIPVVCMRAPGGITEIVNVNNGVIVEEPEDLIDKIQEATSIAFDRQQISTDTHNRFSIENMTRHTAQIFKQLSLSAKK